MNLQLQIKHTLWQRGDLSWKLHLNQKIIYEQLREIDAREAVVTCARRFGKSYMAVVMAIEDCLQNPGITVRIIGPEIKQTANIVHPLIMKISADAPNGLIQRMKSEVVSATLFILKRPVALRTTFTATP